MTDVFDRLESNVRSYCRSFPATFHSARGATLIDVEDREFIDFFSGAGALNYGHNPPALKQELIRYLSNDGVLHALDMSTTAKARFLETFERLILQPRGLDYKIMFPGPTGTNSVEVALKLARKATERHNIISFTNGFHGMTLGSLSLTGNGGKRSGAGVPLGNVTHMPFCGYHGTDTDTISLLERVLADTSSGTDLPAAFVLETVQAEGGVNVASRSWLQAVADLAHQYGVLLIVDDIQVGCGRSGPFFSFEPFDLQPDIVCLSKSLSGYGLPMSLTLVRPEHDVLEPGEHNGTFRGHNAAFVTATAAIETFWSNSQLTQKVKRDAEKVRDALLSLESEFESEVVEVRGRGMIQGIEFKNPNVAQAVSHHAFESGLLIETAGPSDEVLKTLPPLTIAPDQLAKGLEIVRESVSAVLSNEPASV
jgi:diaminobutyrate-2-oxoglutarate transaminase